MSTFSTIHETEIKYSFTFDTWCLAVLCYSHNPLLELRPTNLGEESAELLEGLEQAGVADLLDDKDTFWRRVPRQSLAGGILNVPEKHKQNFKTR